jgi:hypothetical protein
VLIAVVFLTAAVKIAWLSFYDQILISNCLCAILVWKNKSYSDQIVQIERLLKFRMNFHYNFVARRASNFHSIIYILQSRQIKKFHSKNAHYLITDQVIKESIGAFYGKWAGLKGFLKILITFYQNKLNIWIQNHLEQIISRWFWESFTFPGLLEVAFISRGIKWKNSNFCIKFWVQVFERFLYGTN